MKDIGIAVKQDVHQHKAPQIGLYGYVNSASSHRVMSGLEVIQQIERRDSIGYSDIEEVNLLQMPDVRRNEFINTPETALSRSFVRAVGEADASEEADFGCGPFADGIFPESKRIPCSTYYIFQPVCFTRSGLI